MRIAHNYLLSIKLNLRTLALFAILLTLNACSSNDELPDERLIEKELYDQAQARLKSENFSSAIMSLETLEARFPFGRYAEQAQAEASAAYGYMDGNWACHVEFGPEPTNNTSNKKVGLPKSRPSYPAQVAGEAKAKNKDDPFRLMGFGHRVYKNYDPRAKVMMQSCHEVLAELGINDPLLELAMELEKIAREDEYFIERNLYPNVDFYSGIILKAMGFPSSMFTVLFAVARTTGWIAQWKEMIEDPTQKIGRPRQLYTGPTKRLYVPLNKR